MREICHVTFDGPCITGGATAWGENVDKLRSLQGAIKEGCEAARTKAQQGHRLALRADFHLSGRRLTLTDVDNMVKVVLDAALSARQDKLVWKVDAQKLRASGKDAEKTEIWFFDLDE